MNMWMSLFKSDNKLEGKTRRLIRFDWKTGNPLIFRTRRECRQWINERYGYIKFRGDLRKEPHGWRLPEAVKIQITIQITQIEKAPEDELRGLW